MSTRNESAYRAGVGAGNALETDNSGDNYTSAPREGVSMDAAKNIPKFKARQDMRGALWL
jgi:hypothetical protein